MEFERPSVPVATYLYEDRIGRPLIGVERYEPKAFKPFHLAWNGEGGYDYVPGIGDKRFILYRLADVFDPARRDQVVYVCEGEKDADTLFHRGYMAVTNQGGPGRWHTEYSEQLRDRNVVILPHNDEVGRRHAARVARELDGYAATVSTLLLPGLGEGGDVSDWFEAGGTGAEFERLVIDLLRPYIIDNDAQLEATDPQPDGPVAVLTRLDEVETEEVSWLWEGWLPRGKLVLLGGHPGDGKSTLTTMMAATLSTGGCWPDGTRAPLGGTIFVLAEDSLGDTVKPRLEQHHADLTKIASLDAIRLVDGRQRAFSLADHLDELARSVRANNVALVVIDPLTAFMTSRNRNDDGETRDLLTPLGQLAERCNATVLCVMHVGKPGQVRRRPLQSFMGSTAFGAVARQALVVHPVLESDRKVLAVIKSNVAILPRPLEWSRPQDSAIVWHGESEHDPETLFQTAGEAKRPRDDAEAFLTEALASGPRLSREVFEEAERLGISKRTLQRVIARVGVESRRIGPGRDAPWHIGLPGVEWAAHAATVAGVEPSRDE